MDFFVFHHRPAWLGRSLSSMLLVVGLLLTHASPARGNDAGPESLGRSAKVTGRYLVSGTTDPVAGARVHLVRERGLLGEPELMASSVTDEEGRFSFRRLKPTRDVRVDRIRYRVICDPHDLPVSIESMTASTDPPEVVFAVDPEQTTVRGQVTDASNRPVKGAVVSIGTYRRIAIGSGYLVALTDSEGKFTIDRVPIRRRKGRDPDPIRLQVSHPEHPNFTSSAMPQSVVRLQFPAGCLLTGSVLDQSNRPVAGVTVSVAESKMGFLRRRTLTDESTLTDRKGNYCFVVAAGAYDVMLDNSELVAPAIAKVRCVSGGEKQLSPLIASPGGWLTGRLVHPVTGEPVVRNRHGRPIRVGAFGPGRPHLYACDAEVNSDGRFRIRVPAGDHFPFVMDVSSERTPFDTRGQEPVKVIEGEVARWFIKINVNRNDEEKVIEAQRAVANLPKDVNRRTEAILAEFRRFNHTVAETDLWCAVTRELVEIGPDAVSVLCEELDQTDQQRMIRRLGFALRAIDDPRAVPALIRAIPKTLQPAMSDYGLIVADEELLKFMQRHDSDANDGGQHFAFGRPVGEVFAALNRITGKQFSEQELDHIHRAKDARSRAAQQQQYQMVAQQWADWWKHHYRDYGVDASQGDVGLQPIPRVDLSALPVGLELTADAELDCSISGLILSPAGDGEGEYFFLDVDTGRLVDWLGALPMGESPAETVQRAAEWAGKQGIDLMCVAHQDGSGKRPFVLRGVGMQLWEIKPEDAENIRHFVRKQKLPGGRKIEDDLFLHFDTDTADRSPKVGSSFLYLTREQGLGIITVTDFVTQARDIHGLIQAPRGVGRQRGVRFDWTTIAR